MSYLEQLLLHIRGIWPDLTVLLQQSGNPYQSLPLCVMDAVFSIGVRYESTERAVANFCAWSRCNRERSGWNDDREYTVEKFIGLLESFHGDWKTVATEVFQNQQRTSSRSGILKAEAVYYFARALRDCDIDELADLSKTNPEVDATWYKHLATKIAEIPGQSSGISLKYFLMLAGYDGFIKPDRMVARFVAAALGQEKEPWDFENLVLSAVKELQSKNPKITAVILDYGIWDYQRKQSVIKREAYSKTARPQSLARKCDAR